MEQQARKEKYEKMVSRLDEKGVPRKEIDDHFAKEVAFSKGIGMGDDEGQTRALIATVNFYRKVLERLSERIKFMCFGYTQATDYGLKRSFETMKKVFKDGTFEERDALINKGLMNERGMMLHTAETTFFEEKIGTVINIDDEISQQMYGIIESEGKNYPAMIRLNGKSACDQKKPVYQWLSISGDQGSSKTLPGWLVINTRNPGIRLFREDIPTRVDLPTIRGYINECMQGYQLDLDTDYDRLIHEANKGKFFVLNGAKITHFEVTQYSPIVELTSSKATDDADIDRKSSIEGSLPSSWEPEEPTDLTTDQIIFVTPREKKPNDKKHKVNVLGIYIENPAKRNTVDFADLKGDAFLDQMNSTIKYSSEEKQVQEFMNSQMK